MADDAVAKVTRQADHLRDVYRNVFSALNPLREILNSALASPDTIDFEQLAAVLKALKSSTGNDKLQMENEAFLIALTTDGKRVGDLISDGALQALGLDFGDLRDFMRETGWYREGGWDRQGVGRKSWLP